MANSTSLACYIIRVVDKGTRDKRLLGQLSPTKDLITVFTDYLDYLKSEHPTDDEQQVMGFVSQYRREDWKVNGIIQTGAYGTDTEIHNVVSKSVAHQKGPNEAEMMPYYFLAYLPSEYDEGVLLLQRRSGIGVRKVFLKGFTDFIAKSYQGVSISANPFMPRQLLEEYLKTERLTSLRLIQFGAPSDIVVTHDTDGHVEKEGTVELRISANRGGRMSNSVVDKISSVLKGDVDVTEMVEIYDFKYEQVKAEINVKGKSKTFNLSKLDNMNSYHDISREVRIDDDGFPVFDSIDRLAQDLLDGLLGYL